jgi:hypothetical protein
MNKLLTDFCYWFEYTILYIFTSPRKLPYYHRHMWEKYGTRYCTQKEFNDYWKSVDDDPTSYYMNQDD